MAYQNRILATGTTFNPEDNGVWTLADCTGDGTPDLVFIKTRNTGSGKIEVHYTPGESRFQQAYHSYASVFGVEDNGTWLMQSWVGDGRDDLVYIKTRDTGTGKVEVHVASAASNYSEFVWHSGSCFGLENDGVWTMSNKGDLVYIKTKNTGSNKIEIHVASRSSDYQQFTVHEPTGFDVEDNGTWCISPKVAGSFPDLYYIKNRNVQGVEVHAVSASSNWKSRIIDVKSGFGREENGTFLVCHFTHQQRPDLVYIKTRNTVSGMVEVHVNEYKAIVSKPFVESAKDIRLDRSVLHAELARNDGSWRSAEVDLNTFLGNINGEFTWNKKDFYDSARTLRLEGSILSADLQDTNQSWHSSQFELRDVLLNNDGAFQAIDVPVILAIPKEQEAVLLQQLGAAASLPEFNIQAFDEKDGATTFYVQASAKSEGTWFRTYSADAKGAIVHVVQSKGKAIEQVNVDVFTAHANATASSINIGDRDLLVYVGADAGVSLFKAEASIFDLNLGVGVETGAGVKDGSLDVHVAGCGFQIGKKLSISVFGSSFGFDFGRLFG
jgi:hypothetical protein